MQRYNLPISSPMRLIEVSFPIFGPPLAGARDLVLAHGITSLGGTVVGPIVA
jgi:hypothetical protein